MNKFFQISCLIVMSLLLVSSKRFQLLGKTKLNCRKDSSNQVSKENYIDCLSKLLRDESRKEDKDMMDEIARAFVENKRTDKFSDSQIEEHLGRDIEDYVELWKRNMYIKLIDQILHGEYDKEFLEEMLKDPDFYGLTYDSYKILNFKFDN